MPISDVYTRVRGTGPYHQPDIRRKMLCRSTQKKRRLALRRNGRAKK